MTEYPKQYHDKAVYLRDVLMWIEDSLTALDIWSGHANPHGDEAEIHYEIIQDFRDDLKKDFSIMVKNAIDDILSNVAKCSVCEEPLEWCAYNTPWCAGNEKDKR